MHPAALLLALAASPWLPAPTIPRPTPAAAARVRGAQDGQARARELAAAALAAGDAKGLGELLAAHVEALSDRDQAQAEATRRERELVNRQRVLRGLELRLQQDSSLEDVVERTQREVELLQVDVKLALQRRDEAAPVLAILEEGLQRAVDAMGTSQRRAVQRTLQADVDKHPDWTVRRAAVRALGVVGGEGTALELQKLMAELLAERAKLLRKLPKAEADALELEARMQEEANQTGGRIGAGTREQYDRARAEAGSMRTACVQIARLADDCVDAAARALGREAGETRTRTISDLLRALNRAKDGARLRTLELLARAADDEARAACRLHLAGEKDPAAIATLLQNLARLGDQELVPGLCERWLVHEAWIVRAAAAEALAHLRAPAGVPAMIARLEVAEGRERTDLAQRLRELTGQRMRAEAVLWARWWEGAEASFQPAPAEAGDPLLEDAEAEGVTFFGIRTDSQRVLFVLDVSGSMNWSLVVRDNPYDDPGKTPDLPRAGEMSRLAAAKQDLLKALAGLRDGAVFNLVLYASDVWTWEKGLVEMDAKAREEVKGFVERLTAVGGTNLFGALREAFQLAGTRIGDDWREPPIDTIFVLTDGKPSVGTVLEPDAILSHVREWNRAAGITIHAIGLSGAQDAYLLENLALQNGGKYVAR